MSETLKHIKSTLELDRKVELGTTGKIKTVIVIAYFEDSFALVLKEGEQQEVIETICNSMYVDEEIKHIFTEGVKFFNDVILSELKQIKNKNKQDGTR
jgi:hypothetical protein